MRRPCTTTHLAPQCRHRAPGSEPTRASRTLSPRHVGHRCLVIFSTRLSVRGSSWEPIQVLAPSAAVGRQAARRPGAGTWTPHHCDRCRHWRLRAEGGFSATPKGLGSGAERLARLSPAAMGTEEQSSPERLQRRLRRALDEPAQEEPPPLASPGRPSAPPFPIGDVEHRGTERIAVDRSARSLRLTSAVRGWTADRVHEVHHEPA